MRFQRSSSLVPTDTPDFFFIAIPSASEIKLVQTEVLTIERREYQMLHDIYSCKHFLLLPPSPLRIASQYYLPTEVSYYPVQVKSHGGELQCH